MKTKDEMIKQGYAEDWSCKCEKCGSYNCHEYADCILCFDCKEKIYKEKIK